MFYFQNTVYLQRIRIEIMVNFVQFQNTMHPYGCFSLHQAKLHFPGIDRSNFTRWVKQGLLLRLRQEWYAFPDMLQVPDFARFVAERIYKPSYISLHSALSFYGMIPEAVMRITSVTTLKTASFENDFAQYSYQSVKPALFFGYEPMTIDMGPGNAPRAYMLATPEKALIDLLYLYPEYKTEEEMLELRLDEDYMQDELRLDLFSDYQKRIGSKALNTRVNTLRKAYNL